MHSTKQAAQLAGITKATLNLWMASGAFKAPPVRKVANVSVRLWSKADIKRLKSFKAKHYRAGQGKRTDLRRKKRGKRTNLVK